MMADKYSATNDLAQSSPLLLVFNELAILSHDAVDNFNDFAEATDCTFDLYEAADAKAGFTAMLEHDEQLDAE